MSQTVLQAVLGLLATSSLITVPLAVRQWRIAAPLRRANAALADLVRAWEEEAAHLVQVRLPALRDCLQQGSVPVPGLRHEQLAQSRFGHSLETVMGLFAEAMRAEHERAGRSAQAALLASMRTLQGLASEQQLAISAMQERHIRPEILQDLMEVDHKNAQILRRAAVIAVLCGAWPGRQRNASPVEQVVRGAISRIADYLRVRIHTTVDIAVIGRVVEPVVLAVAELLDNAARHSPPSSIIGVSIEVMQNGVAVIVDDGGVGMNFDERRQATSLMSGTIPVDVTKLGDPPRCGFPAIGVLSQRYGFHVAVEQSPYAGVRAVVLLPHALLTRAEDVADVPAMTSRPPVSVPAEPQPMLPRRQRRQPISEPQPAVGESSQALAWTPPPQDPSDVAAAMGAFQRGSQSGRKSTPPHHHEGNQT